MYVWQESNQKDIEDSLHLRFYCKIFCTNDELEWTQNQVVDILSHSKNPYLLLLRPDARYIEMILVFHSFGRIEYLHNEGVV